MAEAPDELTQTKRGTRADHVVRQVKNYIFANRLKPGDRLPGEYDLARQLNVSRPTLREAIKGLSVSGLLESRPRSGTRVREFAYEQVVEAMIAQFFLSDLSLREVLEARAALELAALPFVLKRISPEQIADMRDVQTRFESATRGNGDHIELDLRLHEMFLAASGNRLLSNMVGLLRAFFAHPSLEDAILKRHFDQEEIDRTVHEHRLLIEAAAAHDDSLATRVLREHFDRQLRWLEAEEAGGSSEIV